MASGFLLRWDFSSSKGFTFTMLWSVSTGFNEEETNESDAHFTSFCFEIRLIPEELTKL
jgi:hypothetical protein